jgi:hypothetical protein
MRVEKGKLEVEGTRREGDDPERIGRWVVEREEETEGLYRQLCATIGRLCIIQPPQDRPGSGAAFLSGKSVAPTTHLWLSDNATLRVHGIR